MNKLYKKDSKGKIREWVISCGNDQRGNYYETTHGEQNGVMQTHRTYVESGKNIGRSNETTAEEQAAAEALSEWTFQRDRKGYTENIPTEQPFRPMLAKKFPDEEAKVKYPCAVQPKKNGARCIAKITEDGVQLISRSMKLYEGLEHIEKQLAPIYKKYGITILDGELYNPNIEFEEIMSLVRKTKNHTSESIKIEYHVYDMISDKSFHQRFIDWSNIINGLKYIVPVPTFIVKTREEIEVKHKEFVKNGEEGTIIRNLDSKYKMNSRSSDLQKYKNFDDNEFEITGWKSGVGKFEKVPTFELKTKEGYSFEAVPKGSEEQREEYLKNANTYIGKFATVRHFGYTATAKPVPLFPVLVDMSREIT